MSKHEAGSARKEKVVAVIRIKHSRRRGFGPVIMPPHIYIVIDMHALCSHYKRGDLLGGSN